MADNVLSGGSTFAKACAVSLVLVAGAAAIRVAMYKDPFSLTFGSDGVDVKVGQVQDAVKSASDQLDSLEKQLSAEELALKQSQATLQERDREVHELLQKLQVAASQPNAAPTLKAYRPAIATLATRLEATPPAPKPPSSQAVGKQIEILRLQLQSASSTLKSIKQ